MEAKLKMDEGLNKTMLDISFSVCFQSIILWFFWCTVINIRCFLRKALCEPVGASDAGGCWGGFCFAGKIQGQT